MQVLHGLRPEGAEALLASLPRRPDLGRSFEVKVTGSQVEDFLHPCAGVEHGKQQGAIPPTVSGSAVRRLQQGLQFIRFEIPHRKNAPINRAASCLGRATEADHRWTAAQTLAKGGAQRNSRSHAPVALLGMGIQFND